jgi:hypothetical protein
VRETEIPLPTGADCNAVERMIDEAIAEIGLQITLRGTLKRHPGCIHWHVKNDRESGTLEVTLWPEQHRAWFSVQDGRTAAWINKVVARLSGLLQQTLSGD